MWFDTFASLDFCPFLTLLINIHPFLRLTSQLETIEDQRYFFDHDILKIVWSILSQLHVASWPIARTFWAMVKHGWHPIHHPDRVRWNYLHTLCVQTRTKPPLHDLGTVTDAPIVQRAVNLAKEVSHSTYLSLQSSNESLWAKLFDIPQSTRPQSHMSFVASFTFIFGYPIT